MSDVLFGPVTFGGGATWYPLATESDGPDLRTIHCVMDVVNCLRGAKPNMNLGQADSFVWAGEWELALDEIEAVITAHPKQSNDLAETMLARARAIMASS